MIFEIKCGHCNTIFPVKIKEFAERQKRELSRMLKNVVCPSCMNQMPEDLSEHVKNLVFNNGSENWKIGLHFTDEEKLIDN